MIAYLWIKPNGRVSNNWHDGGSILITAAGLSDARAAWDAYWRATDTDHEDADEWMSAVAGQPNRVWALADDAEPEVFAFEDAGCC